MNIDNLVPDTFYLSGFAALFLLFIYLPIFLVLVVSFWKKARINKSWKVVLTTIFATIATIVPLGDVYISSLQMERYCKTEAGTHIYRTVNADGFLNLKFGVSKGAIQRGYKYIEGYKFGKYQRMTKEGEEFITEEIEKPKSQYSYDYEIITVNNNINKHRQVIKEINSGKILAEDINFNYFPGWLDRVIFLSWLDYNPPHCELPHFFIYDFYMQTLIPPLPNS